MAYASTFHSCQGLTLDYVGIDLTTPVFTHGQLYTALSQVRNQNCTSPKGSGDNPQRDLPGDSHLTYYHQIDLRFNQHSN